MANPGSIKRARRKSVISRQIKKLKGIDAHDRHKASGIIPAGTNEKILLAAAQQEAKAKEAKKTKPKTEASGKPHPPFTIKSPLGSIQGLDPSVIQAAGDFITQATAYTSDMTPYEQIAQQTDPDVVSNILRTIMTTTTSPEERDYVVAALGRIRGAMGGLEDPGPLPTTKADLVNEIASALGINTG